MRNYKMRNYRQLLKRTSNIVNNTMFLKWTFPYTLLIVFNLGMDIAGCRPGYFGHDCKMPCRFPNYGLGCQSECKCLQQQCDHIVGCKHTSVYTTVTDDSSHTQVATDRFSLGILYVTYNFSAEKETQNKKSIWTGLNSEQKFMLISICIIGSVFLTMLCIYITCNANQSALVHLYRSKWNFRRRRPRTVTSAL